jgi:hypothetical protein
VFSKKRRVTDFGVRLEKLTFGVIHKKVGTANKLSTMHRAESVAKSTGVLYENTKDLNRALVPV